METTFNFLVPAENCREARTGAPKGIELVMHYNDGTTEAEVNAATNIGTGTTTSAVAVGGGTNTVALGGGTAFHAITYGAATTAAIPNLAANGTVTATAAVTGCAVANHLLITESSYSVNQTVVVKSATCSAVNTATITFLNTNNVALAAAGTLTFKYMVIKP